MKRVLGRRGLAGACVVVVAIAAGGIAYASIPLDSNGVIHGCYNSDNGALRVFGKSRDSQQCNAGEKALDWSQTGPTGATGPSDGGSSATGSNTTVAAGGQHVAVSGTEITQLPAGTYVYSASVFITPSAGTTRARCSAGSPNGGFATNVGDTTVSTPQWIPVVGKLVVKGNSADIECNEDDNVNGFNVHGALIVTRVGTLH